MQKDLPSIELNHLDDQELRRLIMLWRTHATHGSHEAQGIVYAFEAELTRRRIFASVATNDSAFN